VIRWDEHHNLLMADTVDEARGIAHPSGPRQVGVETVDGLCVYDVSPKGVQLTYHPDHWGLPAWHAEGEPADAFDVLSPDGFSVQPGRVYRSHRAAELAAGEFSARFAWQGFYKAAWGERIPLGDIVGRCRVVTVGQEEEENGYEATA
jgi:hypothetical protein